MFYKKKINKKVMKTAGVYHYLINAITLTRGGRSSDLGCFISLKTNTFSRKLQSNGQCIFEEKGIFSYLKHYLD